MEVENFMKLCEVVRFSRAVCESHVVLCFAEIAEIRCCIINGGTDMREQRAELEGPGVSTVSTVSTTEMSGVKTQMRCLKMSQTEMCFELSQFCHNFSERKMEGFKIMVLQWCLFMGDWLIDWLIDWLGSLDSLGSVRGSTLSTLLWFYASVIISNVYLVCNSAAWYLWCIAPDSLKCLGIPNSFPMHLRSYLELGWFKSFFCLANFTNHFDITTLEMEYRGGGDVRNF